MELFEAIYEEGETEGVFGISLVDNPATQEVFLTLSEDKELVKFATISEEKRLLVGLVLQPNQKVYRNQGGEEFEIFFSDDTIEKLAHNFFIKNYHQNSTIEHDEDEKIQGVTFVESWIVEDTKKDKSAALGLSYPKGSWLTAMKVNSDEIWNDYVKTGKVKGFSIDGVVKLKKTTTKNDIKMGLKETLGIAKKSNEEKGIKMSLKEKLENSVKELKLKNEQKETLKLGQVMLDGGAVIFEYEGEMMEVGGAVFAIDPENPDEKIPVPVGEYPLEDGKVLMVSEEGIVGEIKDPNAEEEEVKVDEPVAAEAEDKSADGVNQIKSILIKYQEDNDKRVEQLETQFSEQKTIIAELKETIENLKKEVVEFGEQPREKKKGGMAEVQLNSKGRILEKLRKNNNQN